MQISLGFFGNSARVAIVGLARDWIDNGANEAERWLSVEDIDPSRRRIGNNEHVRSVDHFPSADARAVEAEAIGKNFVVVLAQRSGEMLPRAKQIGELVVHKFHVVVFDHFADVGWGFVFGHGIGWECWSCGVLEKNR